MSTKTKIIVSLIVVAVAFVAGRRSAPEKVKTVQVEKVVTVVERKVIRIKKNKDGSEETEIIVDKKKDSKTDTITKENPTKTSTTNISLLAGTSSPKSDIEFVYGVSASKELIGPITLGAWVLTNKSVGLSIGLNF